MTYTDYALCFPSMSHSRESQTNVLAVKQNFLAIVDPGPRLTFITDIFRAPSRPHIGAKNTLQTELNIGHCQLPNESANFS